ncbi:Modification methylase SinI (Cytosine-specific methyltransferase SinI) [Arcticibacter svalbardensis MN12-7]|uniref:DNA (cytosine-5-)-methyltransferase n=1 Tax=Arcticibacter svalbardensis MN12-7 TaxID=1150600 RepID=R9GXC3_9SPHI|nr:DNA cytosine methyltransferase [Arcticibacter svalbardensis]EOR96313.1 Modification methylase SinI (Cytosine-specific methyltransferase SinI) [Arcticibacter svalbardensis MN12-7]
MYQENFYSVEDAAEALNFSPQYVRKLLREDKLIGVMVGKTWVIPSENVDSFDITSHQLANTELDRKSTLRVKVGIPKVLSFFSGAMGLDLGLEKAGFQTLLTCEIDKASRKTIIFNKPNIGLIGDIRNYSADQVLEFAGLKKGEPIELMAGGPPCQAFSTAGNRKGFEDERGNVFLKYLSLIEDLKPQYIVLENVRGILSTKFSLEADDDISKHFTQAFKDTPGSALYYIKKRLERAGYIITFNLYNSANFGAPQIRERVIITGTLSGEPLPFLHPTHSENGEFGLKKWKTFRKAIQNLPDQCDFVKFPEKRLKFYRLLSEGQNWRNLSPELQKEALGKSYYLGGGKTGFFRRIAWDRPAPTVVTHPAMPATDLAHPVEDRPLSVQEYKRVQEFPDDWTIEGSTLDRYRQIGNAVPVSLGKAVGELIMSAIKGDKKSPINDFKFSRYNNTSNKQWLIEIEKQII